MAERLMKDSGIEWIGMIPSGWSIKRTKTEFTSHKDIVGDRVNEFERLALTLNGVIRRSKEDDQGLQPEKFDGYQILRKNELVFKLIDLENVNTSRVGLSPYTGLVSPAYIVLSKRLSFSTKYAEYFFLSMWQREVFNHLGDDGVRSSLNASDLLNVPLTIPSAEEQARIADFLDKKVSEIDAVISKTKESIEEYKKLKQSIITEVVTKGLDPNVEMKDSGIKWVGNISKAVDFIKLKNLLKNTKDNMKVGPFGSDLKGADIISEGEYWIYNQRTVLDDNYMNNNSFVDENKYNSMPGFHVNPGDILITTRGTIGKISIVPENAPKGILHPCIIKFVIDEEKVNKRLLRYIFNDCELISRQLMDLSNSTTIEVVYSYNLKEVKIPVISISEQIRIVKYLDSKCSKYDVIISKKEQILTELEQYKKSLIYEYVTGKREAPYANHSS